MKALLLTWAPAVAMLVLAFWWWKGLWQEGALLAEKRTALGRVAPQPAATVGPTGKIAAKAPDLPDLLTTTLREIKTEGAALAELKREAEDLAARMPSAAGDEIIVSFGKVEDMGSETGVAVRGLLKQFTGQEDPDELENSALEWMRVQGRVPEIQSFEETPAEIARFQSRALQEALGLPAATEAAMQPLIQEAFAEMAAQGLTARHKPSTEPEAWIKKRSRALRQLMLKLRPYVPESEGPAARQALTTVLNLGAGFETKYETYPRTDSSDTSPHLSGVVMTGVHWPKVPW
ncbi:MAG TPA: hypothetical protein VD994_02125 [Prosthecobacter sp.]|nr:hypothetical protein [Prosthecobacter sp.]